MNLICHGIHSIWELLHVNLQEVLFVSSIGPTIIQDYIVVSNIAKAGVNECLGGIEEQRFGHITSERIPIVLELCQKLDTLTINLLTHPI